MQNSEAWTSVNAVPGLEIGELQLFKIDLSSSLEAFDPFSIKFLSESEVTRLSKYRFQIDKLRFGLGRLALKLLMGYHLGSAAQDIIMSIDEYGKPSVQNGKNIKFNISHSGRYILIGLCLDHDLGVDTEVYQYGIDHLNLAKSVFSSSEQTQLKSRATSQQVDGFYRCWSMKESVIKAIGLGLGIPLDQFTVDLSLDPMENRLLDMTWDESWKSKLVTQVFSIGENHAAAYTCHPSIDKVSFYDLTTLIETSLASSLD